MKIIVIGGSGLIGSKMIRKLNEHGHEAVSASPESGVNSITGVGLAEAFKSADVVVDVSNSPSFADDDVLNFFTTSTTNILAAEKVAGVRHHVALSVVGSDRLPESGYLRAKVAQEALIRESGIPYSIVRATQFFEFIGRIADGATEGNTVRLSTGLMQPMAAEDVATAVARVSVGTPVNGIVEVGGPEKFPLADLARKYLAAHGDKREVVADPMARYFGTVIDERSLVTGQDARIADTHLENWLTMSLAPNPTAMLVAH